MDTIAKCLGANIRTFREKLGITQGKLAERTDLSIWTIGQLEAGKVWLGLETVAALARVLEVSEPMLFQSPHAVAEAAKAIAEHDIKECARRLYEHVAQPTTATAAALEELKSRARDSLGRLDAEKKPKKEG